MTGLFFWQQFRVRLTLAAQTWLAAKPFVNGDAADINGDDGARSGAYHGCIGWFEIFLVVFHPEKIG